MGIGKLYFLASFLATILNVTFALLVPLVVKFTVDNVLKGEPLDFPLVVTNMIEGVGGVNYISDNLWICGLIIVIFTMLQGFFGYHRNKNAAVSGEIVAKRLKDEMYDHMQKLPYGYHVKAQTGDLIQRATSDVETVRKFLANHVVEVVRTLTIVVISVYIMLGFSVKLTLTALAISPFMIVCTYIYFKNVKKQFLKTDEKEGELSTVLQENLSGVRVVRAFGRQKFEVDKFEKKNFEFRKLVQGLITMMGAFWAISDIFAHGTIAAVLAFGAFLTYNGEITLGTLIVFNTYTGMLIWPLRGFGRILSEMGKMQVSLGRVYEILETPAESETEGAVEHSLTGDIVFENVNFAYEEQKPILQNMSFKVKAGETIAILGSTGSGKSTLMHILLRLYDYNSGSIKINGVELKNIKKDWLRKKVGIVLQEPFLFSKTIVENLKMKKAEASIEEVHEASEIASIHDSILSFEKGYETMVGEKGVTLSGGEKQRVAIARTIINDSQILIFDDSLSAVDSETDMQIRRALKKRSKHVTTFIISQRISTLMEADRIFVLGHGNIADSGTHDELVKREGLYKRIWDIQNLMAEA